MTPTSQPGAYGGAVLAYMGDRAPTTYNHSLRATKPTRMFMLPAKKYGMIMAEWFPMAVHLLDGAGSAGWPSGSSSTGGSGSPRSARSPPGSPTSSTTRPRRPYGRWTNCGRRRRPRAGGWPRSPRTASSPSGCAP